MEARDSVEGHRDSVEGTQGLSRGNTGNQWREHRDPVEGTQGSSIGNTGLSQYREYRNYVDRKKELSQWRKQGDSVSKGNTTYRDSKVISGYLPHQVLQHAKLQRRQSRSSALQPMNLEAGDCAKHRASLAGMNSCLIQELEEHLQRGMLTSNKRQ